MITQSYFCTYFLIAAIVIRGVRSLFSNDVVKYLLTGTVVLAMSWFFAFAETWTIESVPYYTFADKDQMYSVGLYFYALYFVPSFPMFFWLDEDHEWTISKTMINSLAAGMLAFILCDFWRLFVGNITINNQTSPSMPFLGREL